MSRFHGDGLVLEKLLEGVFATGDTADVVQRWSSDILADAVEWLRELDPQAYERLESKLESMK